MNPAGEREAATLGRFLAGRQFASVLCSPLRRAIRTCELAGYGDRASMTADLLEWDYGIYASAALGDVFMPANSSRPDATASTTWLTRPTWMAWSVGPLPWRVIAPPEEIITFHQRYLPLPTVSLAYPLGHGHLVSIDGYQGMRALIFHLVDVHAYNRIALIRAPVSHPYAQERYHAFCDALKEKGLTPNPTLNSPPVNWEQGAEAMRVLLDERGLQPGVDFQAVVAASDLLAIGALSLMTERGIHVPSEVAVAGFNDIEEGRLVRPPLTSVSLPFYEQGRRAVEILLATLIGEETPDHLKLDSQLLVRQSCGCPSWSVKLAAAEPSHNTPPDLKTAQQRTQGQLVEQIARVISNRGVAATWAKQLLDSFTAEVSGRGQNKGVSQGQFQATLNGMLQHGVLDGDETAAWQAVISVLRRELLPALTPPMPVRAEDLLGQARVVIGEAVQRAQIARQLQAVAEQVGGGAKPIDDDALLDEVNALVERPNVLACQFETQFLEVPQECLMLQYPAPTN